MLRPALVAFVLALASVAAAQPAPPTTVYAEAVGPAGLYALGVERAVWTASGGERQLRLRAGASYWAESAFPLESADRVLAVPVGAAALFSLGRPLGLPAAFEFGGGVVLVYRESERFRTSSDGRLLTAPGYAEAAVRASLGRVSVRAGATVGGNGESWGWDGPRPVVGVGVGL